MKKKITLILLLFASCYSFAQNFTLKVTVPATTIVCYIGGDLNGWTPQPLTLLSSNIMTKVFKIDILKEKFTNVFKILSGPEWKYEQVEDNWSAADVKEDVGITVSAFKAIFNPTTSAMSIDFNKPTQAQNLLDGHWKFTTGDNLNWIRTDMDDSKWTEAQIGENWEKWGFSNYDGFAWYRKTVIIPSKLKREVEKKGGLVLKLARIDDVDYTYFNGILIGKTGEMPPNLQSKWEVDRVYVIPANLIVWDKPNSIAVRVYDSSGNGGIYGKDISLMIRGAEDMFKLSTAIKEPDHVIKGVTDYKLPFELQSESSDKIYGKLKVVVCNDYFDTIAINVESIKLDSNSKKTIYIQRLFKFYFLILLSISFIIAN